MDFLNNSGHIFSLNSYENEPIGYEYDETPYIFWINDTNDNQTLSVKNYYVKTINILFKVNQDVTDVDIDDILNIDIKLDSKIFNFIPANLLQEQIINGNIDKICTDYYNIYNNQLTQILTNNSLDESHKNDLVYIKIKEDSGIYYILIPVYVIGYVEDPGTWTSNMLIHISYKNLNLKQEWCPVTIGGTFVDKYETLYIHGTNMGVDLPPDILKAVNGVSFFNDHFDEAKYNEKLKEYLINYMGIKGERGNYNSAIQSIKWFGFSNIISISKLFKTDNEFKEQFVRDYFDVKVDILKSFRYFLTTQYISIGIPLNAETGEHYKQDINKTLWGEGLPILEDFANKKTLVYTPELLASQEYAYLSTYFKYTITELGLKLAAMHYYLEKYFLPIFIKLKTTSLEYKVYHPDTKFISRARTMCLGGCYTIFDDENEVEFDSSDIYYFTHQKHYVDELMNEFSNLNADSNENVYEINDTCVRIPIKFLHNIPYSCLLFLYDKDNIIYKSRFQFFQREDLQYQNFIFYPKLIDKFNNIYECIDKEYKLCLLVNNKWYTKTFKVKISEFVIKSGTLNYRYYNNDINYLYYLKKNYDNDNNSDLNIWFDFCLRDHNEDNPINITNYIRDYDFFDNPTQYVSNFRQIRTIDDTGVKFNRYMWNNNLVNVNTLKFASEEYFEEDEDKQKRLNNLLSIYNEKVNIINDNKYLNHIILYDLYEKATIESEIPIFDNKFRVRVNGLTFTRDGRNAEGNNYIHVSGTNYSNINTLEGIDYYLFDNTKPTDVSGLLKYNLNENEVYMYYLKRDNKYNILPIFDNTEYSWYIDTSENNLIGCAVYRSFEDFQTNTNVLFKDFDDTLFIENGKYYKQKGINNINYQLSFAKLENDEYVPQDISVRDWVFDRTNIYIYVKFYEYNYEHILNYAGYYKNEKDGISYSEIMYDDNNNPYCNITLDDGTIIENVPLYKTQYYYYIVKEGPAYNWNPSFWIAINGDDYDTIADKLNSLQDNWITSSDDIENHTAKYMNVLCKDITGLSGEYCLSGNDKIRISIDGQEIQTNNATQKSDTFILTGEENCVIIYFVIPEGPIDIDLDPKLIKINEVYNKKQFDENIDQVELYKEFFKQEYIISSGINEPVKTEIDIWNSAVPFINNEFYDMYLMHDNTSWYIIQISKDTLNNLMIKYKNYRDIQNEIRYEINDKVYILKAIKTDTRFLINRMKYTCSNGINHFSKDSLIVVSIENNDMLPLDILSDTKWNIKPLSVGMKNKANIFGSTNMSIVSIPNNDNYYQPGYYEITTSYSVSKKHTNKQTLKTKILIK